jgi:two-component system response regulator AtoC
MIEQTILVADDSETIRDVLSSFLGTLGYRVATAADGQAALDQFRSGHHDLVITDLQMPRLEGQTLLKLIKAIEPDVQVIIITGHATLETAVEALRLGAYDYLLKPIEDMEAGQSGATASPAAVRKQTAAARAAGYQCPSRRRSRCAH